MKKHLLLLPFMALLATSCASYANTTTPVVKNAPSVSLSKSPLRAYPTTGNVVNFNVSGTATNNNPYYIDLTTGTQYGTMASLPNNVPYTYYYNRIMFGYKLNGSSNPLNRSTFRLHFLTYTFTGIAINQWLNSESGTTQYAEMTVATGETYTLQGTFVYDLPAYYENLGYNEGHSDGYDNGYDEGYYDGELSGYDQGYNEGLGDGIDEGLDLTLAQTQFLTTSQYYDGLLFLPSQELLRQYAVDLIAGTKTFLPFVLRFAGTNDDSFTHEELPLFFNYFEEPATNSYYIYIYWGEQTYYTNPQSVVLTLKQCAVINLWDIANNTWASTRIAQWDTDNWEFMMPNTPSIPYWGRPLNIQTETKIKRDSFYLGNPSIWAPNEQLTPNNFYVGSPTSEQNNTIQEELNILFVGSGALYAEGYADGQQEAIETSEAYNNVFLIFLPAFSAVATFFNMQVGPFKLYYFFVIPLIIAILVLVIKLVKH